MQNETRADPLAGLTSEEAQRLRDQFGPNSIPEHRDSPYKLYFLKYWAPVPWMLEAVVILELILKHWTEAVIIALLLAFNGTLSFISEQRAQTALSLLRQKLQILSRVRRDGEWQTLPAAELVPGDVVHVRAGDILPADMELLEGQVSLDASTLTGESLPMSLHEGDAAQASCVVQRGEATGRVTATGSNTTYGRTVELVRQASAPSNMQRTIFRIVRYLVVLDISLSLVVFSYAVFTGMPLLDTLSFVLLLLVASVPVALPATYALANALAAQALSKRGVLVTRLAAVEDAAAMTTLVSDKTGTLTQNRLSLVHIEAVPGVTPSTVLYSAAMASDDSTQDPIDLAILTAFRANAEAQEQVDPAATRLIFTPFDPSTRRSESLFIAHDSKHRFIKGAANAVEETGAHAPPGWLDSMDEQLAADGARLLAVAAGDADNPEFLGLIALSDPPRQDAAGLIASLRNLGIRVRMATGDAAVTARAIASSLGLGSRICDQESIKALAHKNTNSDAIGDCDVYARVLPEDKYRLVCALQAQHEVTGMTGDGVNDAPALRQAELGIAVASATDVAKAAAGIVLTHPGLTGVLDVVKTGREVHRRMLTYTLNKIVKTMEIIVFLTLGVLFFHDFVISPILIVLLLFANDFVTMSISSDRVESPRLPQRWQVDRLMITAGILGMVSLVFSLSLYAYARQNLGLSAPQLQTLLFLILVCTNQAGVYALRTDGSLWSVRPSSYMAWASAVDLVAVALLASMGWLMAALPFSLVMMVMGASLLFLLALNTIKQWVFPRYGLSAET